MPADFRHKTLGAAIRDADAEMLVGFRKMLEDPQMPRRLRKQVQRSASRLEEAFSQEARAIRAYVEIHPEMSPSDRDELERRAAELEALVAS